MEPAEVLRRLLNETITVTMADLPEDEKGRWPPSPEECAAPRRRALAAVALAECGAPNVRWDEAIRAVALAIAAEAFIDGHSAGLRGARAEGRY